MSGTLTATRHLSSGGGEEPGGPAPRVLVLTMFDTDADIARAIEAGATGYLLKAERPEELFAAIRNAALGRTAMSAPVADRVLARLRSPRPSLSARERDILHQLALGLGNREIARALFISEATVKTHLGRIYGKLGVETRAGPWRSPRRSGCCPDGTPEPPAPRSRRPHGHVNGRGGQRNQEDPERPGLPRHSRR